MRKHGVRVYVSTHAFGRWRTRVDPKASKTKVASTIKDRIRTELRKGAQINKRGALELEVKHGIFAICYPSPMGGWEVATVIKEVEKEAG